MTGVGLPSGIKTVNRSGDPDRHPFQASHQQCPSQQVVDLGGDVVDDLAVEVEPLAGIGAVAVPVTGGKAVVGAMGDGLEVTAEGGVSVVDDGGPHVSQATVGEAIGNRLWLGHC